MSMKTSSIVKRQRNAKKVSTPTEEIGLDSLPRSIGSNRSTIITISSAEQETESINESPLVKIIERKQRKDWAKLVAPVDEERRKKTTESFSSKLGTLFSNIPSPVQFVLNAIEHRHGYTIRSYFQFIIWLFYLNIFTFILCFTCIIMPTYIYPNPIDFSTYAMTEYYKLQNQIYNESSSECKLIDPQCRILSTNDNYSDTSETCLSNSYRASSCCSLLTQEYFVNSSKEGENDWREFLLDLTDGTGYLTLTRLFIGYYRNLTQSNSDESYFQTYNMGLAVFLTIAACFLITGILIIRKYGDGMKKSYVQSESFENHFFQYIFARWDYRLVRLKLARRIQNRFQTEIKNIFFERNEKTTIQQFNNSKEKIIFQLQRIAIWILTILMFAGAITAVYFTNQFTFQERAKGNIHSNNFWNLFVEYLPSAVISIINLLSPIIFTYLRNLKLYTRTAALRHYLIRVIIMRLLLLFAYIFIVILQLTCNSSRCSQQSELIDCAQIKGDDILTDCWETYIGEIMYRLVLTDTAVMIIGHLMIDPLRSLLNRCCSKSRVHSEDESIETVETNSCISYLFLPLEFEVGDYVLELTYTQTLCWHGVLFCPFLPLIAAVKNLLIFAVKLFTLSFFRKRSAFDLSPARTRYIFTAVLLFSFVWALLPIAFLTTSFRPSRGCSPFRLYSDEPDYYIYYSIRNLFLQIHDQILVKLLLKITSAVVVIPLILLLILSACVLTIRRNSYRSASIELYKLLYTSHQTHQLAVQTTGILTTTL